MSGQVTVYEALPSPWTYLGWARFRELAGVKAGGRAPAAEVRRQLVR
jgi:2-hydroxychromene-2-carboxylate isomerase